MPRTVADAPLTTKAARERLARRHQAYWRGMDAGAAIGYRKGATAGVWLARVTDASAGGGYRQSALGRADDILKADGVEVLDYRQAEAKAREWIARHHRVAAGLEPDGPVGVGKLYMVEAAIADYLADYAARGGKALKATQHAVNAHILPALGTLPVGRLSRERLKSWHRGLADAPARLRAKNGDQRHRDAADDPDAPRRRRATANRILTIVKAALNHARAEGKASCPADAWSAVKPFREANKARIRYLLDDELTRLVNACPPDFRELVSGALLTGARYGELAAMKAGDFDRQAGTVTIERSKGGKPRHIALTDEGREFFVMMTAGRPGGTRIFERQKIAKQATRTAPAVTARVAWAKSDQFRLMRDACVAAQITPPATFHHLRHTYGSRLAMRGVPMGVIAAQLGHADTRMTERHYAHLTPSYVATTVRRSFGTLGILPNSRLTPLRRSSMSAGATR
jgi:integrase